MCRLNIGPLVVTKNVLFHVICRSHVERYLALKARMVQGAGRLGLYERQNMRLLRTFVRAGSDTIDVGANAGVYTYALARLVGANGRVFAFEPLAAAARWIEQSCGGLRNVIVIRNALSDHAAVHGRLQVPLLPGGVPEPALATLVPGSDSGAGSPVVTAQLDDHVARFRDLSFIKIDAEGHEGAILSGARRTVEKFAPAIQVESAGLRAQARRTQEWLEDAGYALFEHRHGRLVAVAAEELTALNAYLLPRRAAVARSVPTAASAPPPDTGRRL